MSNKLDFIVFGVGRSGTTAVSRYISATEEFHCGIERFHVRVDHSKLTMPFSFFSDEYLPRKHPNFKFSEADIIEKNVRIIRYGNKLPTYFYRLSGVLAEIGQPKGILCARAIRSVGYSFNTRAANSSDSWPRGRTALFACGDAMLLVSALQRIEDEEVLVVPHPAILDDWKAATSSILSFIDPVIKPTFREEVVNAIHARHSKLKKRAAAKLYSADVNAIELIEGSGFDEFLLRDQVYSFREIRGQLGSVANALPNDPVGYVVNAAEKHELPEVREFLPIWLSRVKRFRQRLSGN